MVQREIVFKDYDTPGLELFEVIVAKTFSGKEVLLAAFDKLPEEMTEHQAGAVAEVLRAACLEVVPF